MESLEELDKINQELQELDNNNLISEHQVKQEDFNPCELKEVICEEEYDTGEFTMYTASIEETDNSPFITADGTDLRLTSECILANNILPFSTRIYIKELNLICSVHDRMNLRYGVGNFDIFMKNKSRKEALVFGRRNLHYKVLN